MIDQSIEVKKFRAIYRYSFDEEYFYLYWKKGQNLVEDQYPLAEMSPVFERWRGYPHFVGEGLLKALICLSVSTVILWLTSTFWIAIIGIFIFIRSLSLVYDKIGFLTPITASILSYEDKSGSVLMFHGKKTDEWGSFKRQLSNAIAAIKRDVDTRSIALVSP
ncbi:hypothetical protein [Vreelandella sp. EE27]